MENRDYKTLDIVRIPFKYSKVNAFLIALQKILNGVIPSLEVIATANFLDVAIQILNKQMKASDIFLPIVLVVALIAYQWISNKIGSFVEVKLELDLREKFRVEITEQRAKLEYRHIENQESWDLIARVSEKPEKQCKDAYVNLLSFTALIIRVIGLLGILASQIWWAAIVILVMGIPLVNMALRGGKETYDALRESSKHTRKYTYLGEVLSGREGVLERTLFGYTNKLNEKWNEQYEITRKLVLKMQLKWYIKMKGTSIITAAVSILMVVILIKPVADKALSVGMFISIANGVFSLIQMMSWELNDYVEQLARNKEYLKDLGDLMKLESIEEAIDLPCSNPIIIESLEFKRVSFKYPGTDEYILKDLSFKIEKGNHYAFVGVNGAGKTTITKLITGLYEEFEGDILINEKSIREYNYKEIKAMSSVVYQDFARYFVSFKDNIALGNVNDLNKPLQEEKIKGAVEIMSLQEAIENLPDKINTPLGKIKSNGQDLSGGQWQRIAMARSIVSSATIRILDEPTAALDPISESKIYDEFEKISKGGTTIFISHRLGSTKLAGEIFVIGNGTVIEHGTHEKLMENKGIYAEMYESQRSWYL